jgi:hypothetical protein
MIFPDKSWRIARWMQDKRLKKTDIGPLDFSETDLFNLDIGRRGGDFFLGYFSREGVKIALEKYGLFVELKNRGFEDIIMNIDTSDPFKHKISIFNDYKTQENLLIELVLRKSFFKVNMPFQTRHNGKGFQCLIIDWLSMQNHKAEFTPRKPRLPGQKFPGLGLSNIAIELLMIICWRLKLGCLVNYPEHYHNAFLYSKIFCYHDPDSQAIFLALKKTFKSYPLDKISWGIDWGCVRELNSNETYSWMVSEQLVPVDDTLKKIFNGKKYKKYVNARMRDFKFSFDEAKYQEIRKKITVQSMEKII